MAKRKAREELDHVSIAPTDHVGIVVYLTEDGSWPKQHLTIIPDRSPWVIETGDVFEIEDLTPGQMGKTKTVQVIDQRKILQTTRRNGKYRTYGQAKQLVLVEIKEDRNKFLKEGPKK
jgi:hypothetical protein